MFHNITKTLYTLNALIVMDGALKVSYGIQILCFYRTIFSILLVFHVVFCCGTDIYVSDSEYLVLHCFLNAFLFDVIVRLG